MIRAHETRTRRLKNLGHQISKRSSKHPNFRRVAVATHIVILALIFRPVVEINCIEIAVISITSKPVLLNY